MKPPPDHPDHHPYHHEYDPDHNYDQTCMTANLSQARARPIAVRTWRDFENVARQ